MTALETSWGRRHAGSECRLHQSPHQPLSRELYGRAYQRFRDNVAQGWTRGRGFTHRDRDSALFPHTPHLLRV
jgi:hypothetical protein